MEKYIIKAAIRYDGKIYTGYDHGECFVKLDRDNHIIIFSKITEGFITSDGVFVDRKAAMKIADEAEQLQYDIEYYGKKTLISEDLHLDWLRRQEKEIKDLKRKLGKSTRNEKRLKLKLDILHTDYCLLQDTLENANDWTTHLQKELKSVRKIRDHYKEKLENAYKKK